VSGPRELRVSVNGSACRVWEGGDGPTLGFLHGFGGLPRWTPFLARLAATRRVIAPSLPGFPGSEAGHRALDDIADWVAMTLDLLEAAGLEGADLVGESIGAMLAAEAAAFSPGVARRLVLIGPLGLYDAGEPVENVFANRTAEIPGRLCCDLGAFLATFGPPSGDAEALTEFEITSYRAAEAGARLIWPFGERGLAKRLHRIRAPTLLVWGAGDRVVPASYAKRFADGIAGEVGVRTIEGAGHLASIDAPDAVAGAVLEFLSD
jgi:pimeloyl-ACP methyl ester carboxylesterase